MKRRILQSFSLTLAVICIGSIYANILSNDDEVRKLARTTVNAAAGCGEGCKLESLRGDRGMVEERIEYDVLGHGHWAVVCRREFIITGTYACEVKEAGTTTSTPATSASAK